MSIPLLDPFVPAIGGATGIKYTVNTAAGTPAAGEIRSTNLAVAGTIVISATDAASPGKSAADILARIKVGAIIEIAESLTKRIRATVTTDYTVGSGSFAVSTPLVDGAIGSGAIVFLSIASDAPGIVGPAGPPGSVSAAGAIDLTQVSTPAAPAASHTLIYAKSDGKLYRLNVAGGETEVGTGAGRVTMTANRTYYVRAAGAQTGDLTSETTATTNSDADAFATPQALINALAKIDGAGFIPTISIQSGIYPGITTKSMIGMDDLNIVGVGISSVIGKVISKVSQKYNFSNLKISYSSSIAFDSAISLNNANAYLAGDCTIEYISSATGNTKGSIISLVNNSNCGWASGISFLGNTSWGVFCSNCSILDLQNVTFSFANINIGQYQFFSFGNAFIELGGAIITSPLGGSILAYKEGGGEIRLPSYSFL
jgi:hypothetical protein